MEKLEIQAMGKRMKINDEKEGRVPNVGMGEIVDEETGESNASGSKEMRANIAHILERMDHFTQQASELLEAGKKLFKDLSTQFEERVIVIHEEQMERWQEEIKELKLLDDSNEEAKARLHNAQYLLQGVQVDS